MPLFTRKRTIFGFLCFLLLVAVWFYWQRFTPVALENYVPETALGYVEVNDVPRLLQEFAATDAWQQLAPLYALNDKIQVADWASRVGRWTGIGTKESLLVARGQFALVLSGLEVRGDEVKPRLALLIETHGSEASVRALMDAYLPKLAQRAFQQAVPEMSEYAGIPITIYRAPNSERQILSASLGSTWLIANDAATLQSCIEVRQGRLASVAANPSLKQAQNEVDRTGTVFAFVSNAGAARLSQFFTHLLIGKALAATPLAGLPEGLMAEVSSGTVEALAYSTKFVNGGVTDRYVILCKPQVMANLRSAIQSAPASDPAQSAGLRLIPAGVQDVTLLSIAEPGQALDGVERVISGHLGAAQSFLFHNFFTSARKTFLGLEPGENPGLAIGSEVIRYSVETNTEDASERVWLIAARNQQRLAQWAERWLRQQEANVRRIKVQGIELTTNGKRAFTFVGNFLVLGSPVHVLGVADETSKKEVFVATPRFLATPRPTAVDNVVMQSFTNVEAETQSMMEVLARRLKGKPAVAAETVLAQLPLAATVTAMNESGIVREIRSSVGNVPLAVNFIDSVF